MNKTLIAMMLLASSTAFAAEEAKTEAPVAPVAEEQTVVDQAKDVAVDAKDAVVETADGVWGWVKGLFD
jgi:hypothetical protein